MTHFDPKLFESAFDRAVRLAGIDAKAFASAMGHTVDPALSAAVKAEMARGAFLLTPGSSAVLRSNRK